MSILAQLTPSISVGFDALRINPLRTTLSALGVIIGVGAMVSVLSLSDGVEREIRSQVERDGRLQSLGLVSITDDVVDGQSIQRPSYVTLSVADARDLRRELGSLGEVAAKSTASAVLTGIDGAPVRTRGVSVTGVLANGALISGIELAAGRFFTDAEVDAGANAVVVSKAFAEAISGKKGMPAAAVGRKIRLQSTDFEVVGVFTPQANPQGGRQATFAAFVPLSVSPLAMSPAPRPRTPTFLVKASTIENLPAAETKTKAWLAKRFGDWKTKVRYSSYADESSRLRDNMLIFKILMGAITGISLVVGGIGIMNVLLASVTERTREIGVRKATGARNRDLLAQFLAESVAISSLGSVLGTLLGVAVASGVAAFMRAKTPAEIHAGFSMGTFAVSFAAPIIVGIVFGIYPALRAARLSPIDAIRHE
jgi:putative ABC transport system permease protein